MRSEFLIPAADEFKEAIDWYRQRSVRASEGFRAKVAEAIRSAMTRPTSAGFLVGKRVRKVLLKPYSYGLIYFVHEDVLHVVAVAHNRRRPRYWQSRLTWI